MSSATSTTNADTVALAGSRAFLAPCRFCGTSLETTMVDLGMSPLCETFLTADQLNAGETFFPLHVRVCDRCYLAQIEEYVSPDEIFDDYAYYSSYSTAWLDHARDYVDAMIDRLGLGPDSSVVELASNDGYLLQYFVQKGIPSLGIEPAANVAEVAEKERNVETRVEFFDEQYAASLVAEGIRADLVLGNNVLAQVPDLNSFVAGIATVLAPGGTVTLEFPHVRRLIEHNQFDTIYHEHFSYFSGLHIEQLFAAHGLTFFDVEELWSHGGSLRVYGRHTDGDPRPVSDAVGILIEGERAAGLDRMETYTEFAAKVAATKRGILSFLIEARNEGKRVVGYGAPGKGNTLLNYCGIRSDMIEFTVDRNPYKHGRYLPGTHIPVLPPEALDEARPDYVFILPWNLRDEISTQLAHIRDWGGRFVVPIPAIEVW